MGSKLIAEVLAAHNESLLALPGVVGTAIGIRDGVRCIRVFAVSSGTIAAAVISDRLDGYPVVVEITGPIRPRLADGSAESPTEPPFHDAGPPPCTSRRLGKS